MAINSVESRSLNMGADELDPPSLQEGHAAVGGLERRAAERMIYTAVKRKTPEEAVLTMEAVDLDPGLAPAAAAPLGQRVAPEVLEQKRARKTIALGEVLRATGDDSGNLIERPGLWQTRVLVLVPVQES
jgi:hypothetical protein